MNARTLLCADDLKQEQLVRKTVVVIDVLRASSSIVTAFAHGASSILPTETVAEARRYAEAGWLTGGERYGKHLDGFDFGNSPADYTQGRIQGRDLALTTTNGTRALVKSLRGANILIGCFLNARSCAIKVKELHHDVLLLCAGTRGQFALEDGLAAGCILHYLKEQEPSLRCDDEGICLLHAFRSAKERLEEVVTLSQCGQRLLAQGKQNDLHDCLQLNQYDIVPCWRKDRISL